MSVSRIMVRAQANHTVRASNWRFILALLASAMLSNCVAGTKPTLEKPPYPDPETRVVNLATEDYDAYIGRRSVPRPHMLSEALQAGEDGWLGNPHPIGRCEFGAEEHPRDECIEAFRTDFHIKLADDDAFRKAVLDLRGKRLGCYCKPKPCHGDVIRDYIESRR